MMTLLLAMLSCMAIGCNTHTVLGSDIPPIPEMHKVKLTAAHSSTHKGLLGEVHFKGTCHNALDSADATVVEFQDHGWTVVNVVGDEDEASATLWKEGRDAHLLIKRDPTVPDQSIGAIAVAPGAWTPAPALPETTPVMPPLLLEPPLPSAEGESESKEDAPDKGTEATADGSDAAEPTTSPTETSEQNQTPIAAPEDETASDPDAETPSDTPADEEFFDLLEGTPEPPSDPTSEDSVSY